MMAGYAFGIAMPSEEVILWNYYNSAMVDDYMAYKRTLLDNNIFLVPFFSTPCLSVFMICISSLGFLT